MVAAVCLLGLPLQAFATAQGIHLCDELLALNDTQSLCRYFSPKHDADGHEISQDFEFSGKLYEHGALKALPDGDYGTRIPLTRNFKVENGHVMERANTTALSDISILRFYNTNIDGGIGQRVYQCDKSTDGQWPCVLASNGTYHDRGGATIHVRDGFLEDATNPTLSACHLTSTYGKTAVVCEDRY
ncbi:MAG: hypothetical protein K2X09_00140 [Rickettsiales bacterium]|nr:hypothetical protein [Rickettsiales bacterium]